MKKAGLRARSTGGLAGPYFGTPAASVARGRSNASGAERKGVPARFGPKSSHHARDISGGQHMTRLDWKREEPRFDPTVMMTVLVGLVAAVFLATTM